mgnify:CR=1 FL=1
MRSLTTPCIVPARSVTQGLATIIVAWPGGKIRSRVVMVQIQPHGVVQMAFAGGQMISLPARAVVGDIPLRTHEKK